MKGYIFTIFLLSLFQCGKDSDSACETSSCGTEATVVDLTGLDGCGLVFELADGTRLEPEQRVYIKAPTKEEDPLYYFDLKAGQHVKINYTETDLASICMTGKVVFVTCITECKKPAE